jgi:transcriptional regulator with XRE-family HTH domain
MNTSELERKAGLSATSVRKMLLGSSQNPTLETLNAIANVFECSIDELVGRRVLQEKNTESEIFKETSPLDSILFRDTVHKSCDCAMKRNQNIKLNDFVQFILEAYKYCQLKKDGNVDNEFIEWYFLQKFK